MKRVLMISMLLISVQLKAQLSITDLRCERLVDPAGIDMAMPHFSWIINSTQRNVTQTAYHIIISSSYEKLQLNEGDIWNSGNIRSDSSVQVLYTGKKLKSRTYCYWKVKVETNKGVSAWSETASFSIGLLNNTDWKAKWIGYDQASPWDSVSHYSRLSARYLRKEFQSEKKVKRATVYVVGLGLYELFLNGEKIGDRVLSPAPSDYRKSVFYNVFDVTGSVHSGINAIGTILSNGRFFTMRQNYKPQKINTFGYPKLLLQLEIEYTDGTNKTIVSDPSWKLNTDGPVRTANEYDGEEYDATKELIGWTSSGYDDQYWMHPQMVAAPGGVIRAQMNPPMKVMKTIKPVSVRSIANGKYVVDMGQNFSGWLQLKVSGKAGQHVIIHFGESLKKDGSVYDANLRDAKATDVYTLKGIGTETWHPSFVYHGFRYAEISNYPGKPVPEDFEGQMVYDDLSTIGSIQTSDSIINKIVQNAWWGIASDYKGMPVDCPQRNERQPWLGDRATGCFGESFVFENENLYAKWMDDIEESQTTEGAIPDVAPAFWNYYTDNVTWPGTYLFVGNMLYHQFGNKGAVIKHYASMKKWMKYMQFHYLRDGILIKDKYGDWCVPPESPELIHAKDSSLNTDGSLIATAYYFKLLQLMREFAIISNHPADTTLYTDLSASIKKAFNKKYFNPSEKYYANNSITSNLLPLFFGITPDSEKAAVFKSISNQLRIKFHLHIATGVIGTQWIMRCLTKFEESSAALALATSKTYPGWGYMTEQGATTIWELWNGNTANPHMNSQNHVMLLGDLLIWLFEDVAGIKSDDQSVGFKKIVMRPAVTDSLSTVNASYHTPYGILKSAWNKQQKNFEWNISVPANSSAIVYIPAVSAKQIMESKLPLDKNPAVQFLKMDGQFAVVSIGSGNYSFYVNN